MPAEQASPAVARIMSVHGQQVVQQPKDDGTPGLACVSCAATNECKSECPLNESMGTIRADFDWLNHFASLNLTDDHKDDEKALAANISKFSDKYRDYMDPSQNLAQTLKRDGTLKAMIEKSTWAKGVVGEIVQTYPKFAILVERAVHKFLAGKWADISVDEGQLLANTFPEVESTSNAKEKLVIEAVDVVVGMLMLTTVNEDEQNFDDEGDEGDEGDEVDGNGGAHVDEDLF